MPRHWSDPGYATPADLAACRALLRDGSKSFHAASLLLPDRVREPAVALYAFCRVADDAVDLDGGPFGALDWMHERLDLVYDGRPLDLPVDRAFADVVARFAIPRALPGALFEGFAWDAAGRRYDDLAGVYGYSARVAGTVGAMMALLMGERAPEVIARACDLGVAMQLSNIARDVGEDARAGRLYLPRQWLREAGIDPEAWLAAPAFSPELAGVIGRLLAAAETLYARAEAGIGRLPLGCRPGINAARRLYAEIGRELAREGLDSVTRRTVVSRPRKLALLCAALADTARPARPAAAPPLAETRFIVHAVAAAPARPPASPPAAWWQVGNRAVWVVDLFERLAQRDGIRGEGIEGSSTGP